MGGLIKLIGGAVEAAAKAGSAASKWGKLNVLFRSVPADYSDAEGNTHHFAVTVANDKDLGDGPTLLFMGDLGGEDPRRFEDSITSGMEEAYVFALKDINAKNQRKGKFNMLEEKITGFDYKLFRDVGVLYAKSLMLKRGMREALAKHFKYVDYRIDNMADELPVAGKKFDGEYFARWNLKGKEYRAPVEGVGKLWARTEVINSEELAELSHELAAATDKKYKEKLWGDIESYAKGVLKAGTQ